jgi:hypothetical protein
LHGSFKLKDKTILLNRFQQNWIDMDNSMISSFRQANLFMRSTAMTVVIAFTMMILAPAAIAARTELQQPVAATPAEDNDDTKLSKTLQKVEAKMARLEEKLAKKLDVLAEIDDLKKLRKQLIKLDKKVIKSFGKVKAKLEKHNLPAVILQRHQHTVDKYRVEIAALLSELQAVGAASNDSDRMTKAKLLSKHLKGKKNKRSQQPFDPNQLPNSTLKPDPANIPKETEKAFIQAGLYNTPFPTIAALGDFTFDKLANADNPAYLAETIEVTLSQAIKEKAAELENNRGQSNIKSLINNWG